MLERFKPAIYLFIPSNHRRLYGEHIFSIKGRNSFVAYNVGTFTKNFLFSKNMIGLAQMLPYLYNDNTADDKYGLSNN